MLVSNNVYKNRYVYDGAQFNFPISFPFLDEKHIQVRYAKRGQEDTDSHIMNPSYYMITGAGNPAGGVLTRLSNWEPGIVIVIIRDVPITQLHQYTQYDNFPAESHEDALAKLTMICQELDEICSRAITVPATSKKTPQEWWKAIYDEIMHARDQVLAGLTLAGNVTGATMVVADGTTTPRSISDRFADIINVKDFGAKGDGVTDDTAALKAAILHISLLGGGELQVPEGVYIISDTLIVPDNVVLIGRGVGYEHYHPTTFLFKGTGIKRYSLAEMPVYSIENPDAGAPYLADSGNRGDIYKTLDLQSFSSAVILGKRSGIISIAIIPYFNGILGYRDQSNRGLSDEWDVGIWCRNADSWYLSKTTSIGHWRKAALLITSSDIGDGKIPACEQGHAEFCRFQGFRGVAIRSPEQESNSNWGFAGTDFINCLIKPLEHQGLCLATSSFISTPFDSPSASLEISGNAIRGIQFSMCTLIGRDDISIIAPKCREIRFYGCYQESKGININGVWVPLAGSRMVGGKDTNMQFYGCSKYAIDFSPYYTRESSVARYPSSTGVLISGGVVRDEEYMFPEFGTTNGLRMIPGGVFRIYNSNFDESFTLTQRGAMVLSGDGVNTKKDSFSIKRLYGSESEAFILRTYASGNVEFFTGQLLVGGHFAPTPDGTSYCGMSARRWKEIFAVNGAISTSDMREKQMIADIPESVFRAWSRVNFRQFLFNDAVEKKGTSARLHVGVIAQQVKEAFEAEGLDATRYGILCYDEWSDEWESVEVIDDPVLDENGNEIVPAQTHIERVQIQTAGNRYGIRYEEALALECAYQRWLGERRDARISALELRDGVV